jgi:hypothetical protein
MKHTPGIYVAVEDGVRYLLEFDRDGYFYVIGSEERYAEHEVGGELLAGPMTLKFVAAAPDLLAACRLGGVGYSANILLWNVAGILKEIGEELGRENLVELSAALRHKAEAEWTAIRKAEEG